MSCQLALGDPFARICKFEAEEAASPKSQRRFRAVDALVRVGIVGQDAFFGSVQEDFGSWRSSIRFPQGRQTRTVLYFILCIIVNELLMFKIFSACLLRNYPSSKIATNCGAKNEGVKCVSKSYNKPRIIPIPRPTPPLPTTPINPTLNRIRTSNSRPRHNLRLKLSWAGKIPTVFRGKWSRSTSAIVDFSFSLLLFLQLLLSCVLWIHRRIFYKENSFLIRNGLYYYIKCYWNKIYASTLTKLWIRWRINVQFERFEEKWGALTIRVIAYDW